MIMIADYVLYWGWCLLLYSLMTRIFKKIDVKNTMKNPYDIYGMGVMSLIAYMIIYWVNGGSGFILL